MSSAVLLIHCPDRKGLVARIANFLLEHGANILHADQHQDHELSLFFMRVEWALEGFTLAEAEFRARFQPIANECKMTWSIEFSQKRQAVAIFVSRYEHCLVDLLYRHKAGELKCDIAVIISNHEDSAATASFYGVPFVFVPMKPGDKQQAEMRQLFVLREHVVDLVVLARYMQVLSGEFVGQFPRRIINVHHSFLPSFTGSKPYHAAYERGVKLIGSTSHYVTEALDDGPIIEQDVIRISHRDQIENLIEKGRDLERIVLSRAVRWHLEHRILCYSNKTVVFD